MQTPSSRKRFDVVLVFPGGTRTVQIKAVDRPTAERKALKFNPKATGVKPDGS